MLLFLQDLKGDQFAIEHKFDKLFVDNCHDFKTVPAHVIELNVRNCASFEKVPETVQYLAVYNCPLLVRNNTIEKQINAMNDMIILRHKTKINIPPSMLFMQSIFTNQRSNTMQDTDMQEALKDVTADDDKDAIFVEVLNLRAYVNRLLSRVKNLESKE